MIYITMTDIRFKGFFIPGGWKAPVLEVNAADGEARQLYMPILLDMGYAPDKAEEICIEIVQDRFLFGFIHGLRSSIGSYAHRYARMFPQHVQKDGSLRGFDPETVQQYYLPTVGVGKDSGVGEALREMARDV